MDSKNLKCIRVQPENCQWAKCLRWRMSIKEFPGSMSVDLGQPQAEAAPRLRGSLAAARASEAPTRSLSGPGR